MIYVAIFIIGLFIGYFERSTRQKIRDLYNKVDRSPEPVVGATDASYGKVNEYASQSPSEVGISEPMTPQQLEWLEREKLEKAQIGINVKR